MGNSIEDYRAAIGLFHIRIKGNRRPFKFNYSLKWEENVIRVDCYNLYQKKKIKSIIIQKKWNFRRKRKSWLELRIVFSSV
jgi:hypothetical protein